MTTRRIRIRKPTRGKTTISLARYHYPTKGSRGVPEYVGSFNLSIDPAKLPAGVKLKAGVVLGTDDLADIATYLRAHGTFTDMRRAERDALRAEVRAELELEIDSLAIAARVLGDAGPQFLRLACQSKAPRAQYRAQFDAIEDAWKTFYRAAQTAGVVATRARTRKKTPAA